MKNMQRINLSGNVIEIYQCESHFCAKVLFQPDYLEINIDKNKDLHLGDRVEIDALLEVKKIEPNFDQITDEQV
jgi:hypothetical protein